MKQHAVKISAAVLLAAAALVLLIFIASAMTRSGVQDRDFLAYWAAGRQLAHKANPYDINEVLQLERSVGLSGARPNMMLNWPLAFFITFPLGLVGAQTGMALWLFLIAACLIASMQMLRRSLLSGDSSLHLAGYAFAPVVACMMAGQLGTIMLLGVSAFFYFHRSRPALAGAALILCALKPHLFIPFAIVLVLWAIQRRSLRVLAGAGLATLLSALFAFLVDPAAWKQYAAMMRGTAEIQQDFVPCLAQFFRLALDPHAAWLQFVPAAIGTLWAIGYYLKNRSTWNWSSHGMLVLLVSEMVAPHAWFTDETVLLPALLVSLHRAESRGLSLLPVGIIAGAALVEVLAQVQMTSAAYAWSAPAWLLIYLYATRRTGSSAARLIAETPQL